MFKMLSKAFAWLTTAISGFGMTFFSIANSGDSHQLILLIAGVILSIVGMVFLSKTVMKESFYNYASKAIEPDADTPSPSSNAGFEAMLKTNNEMMSQYNKINKTRDQLKILEIAGAAEEQAKS